MKHYLVWVYGLLACLLGASCGGKSNGSTDNRPATTGSGTGGGRAGALPLTGCVRVAEPMVEQNGCSTNSQCPGGVYLTVFCGPSGADGWTCDCKDQRSTRRYEVNGLTGAALCNAVSDVCALPQPTDPQDCSLTIESREAGSCKLQRDCVATLKTDGEAVATVSRKSNVSCTDYGTGQMSCYCDFAPTFLISGQDGLQACDTLLDTCTGDSPVTYESESNCKPGVLEAGGSGFCETHPNCQRAVDLGSGVTATESGSWDLTCMTAPGGSQCGCMSSSNQGALFDLASPTEGIDTCSRLAPLCGQATPVAIAGEIECVSSVLTGTDEVCTVQLDCKQSATFNGEAIVVYGEITGNCSRLGDEYVCTCTAANDRAQIEVSAGTAWDACAAAAQQCPNAVKVTIGDGVIHAPSARH